MKSLKKALLFAGVSNTGMGIIEIIMGVISGSSSLILDALDFLFDGTNYFSSIYALDKSEKIKIIFGKVKGYIMIITGVIIFIWLIYKYFNNSVPEGVTMSLLGFIALGVNIVSTLLLSKYQNESLDIKAVWLCTRNDAINNILVIIAGVLTTIFMSPYPDIIASIWMGGIAIWSGVSILKGGSHSCKKSCC
ncbi:MAG: cation transporter [Candidatus Gracilibacteria bacterium]|nr:cation transporter [Candidatus Gracilibacteria bacterium]